MSPQHLLADLRTEYRRNPLGIDAANPRLSWQLKCETRGTMQSAYRVRVATRLEALDGGTDLPWDSGKVLSDQSIHVPYAGAPLQSRQRYSWQVRVWNERDVASPWSEAAWWEMGLLSNGDWDAQWIAPPIDPDPLKSTPAPLLRSTFELRGKIARARAYVTSLGLYELHLNGQRVGDALFTPGWTSFDKRLQYQTYDVTASLKQGANAVGAMLGDGWYRRVSYHKNKHLNNGKPLALLVQIEVTYTDGLVQRIVSHRDWKTATGPILLSEIYNGEIYDARLERDGWSTAAYDDRDWSPVQLVAPPSVALIATLPPPVRRIEEIESKNISKTPAGTTVADLGQNMAGWVRLRVRGEAGTVVTLRHAEVLDRDGNFYTENLTTAKQTIQYTLKGQGEEVFEPHFTYQGFRYIAVEGYPGELKADSLTGIVIHSDLEPAGQLETSDPLINQLQHNIAWTLKSNYLDVPTDNPQRAERLGWTLDAAFFSPTAALNMDVAAFLLKWLGDLAADQLTNGSVPVEIPRARWTKLPAKDLYRMGGRESDDTRLIEMAGAPGWSDAATIVPWNLYLAYGDSGILESQYESMARWVEYVRIEAGDDCIWQPALNFGDWADFETTRTPAWFGSNDHDLMATAFYAHSVDIMQRTARVLGREEDSARYARLLTNIRKAFLERFVSEEGRVGTGMQVDYVLALDFDLLPDALRPLAARRLAEDVRSRGHLTTGIVGSQHALNVLSRFGYDEEAYLLFNRRQMPSWLYSVTLGATTIWERWDAVKSDGSFQTPEMNSFNQYALGEVGEWMYAVMAGIAPDPAAPGYKHILIQPQPGGGLSFVKASHFTPYGEVKTAWRIDRDHFHLDVTIPANARAAVRLPRTSIAQVLESGRPLRAAVGVENLRQEDGNVSLEIGSGRYVFVYAWSR